MLSPPEPSTIPEVDDADRVIGLIARLPRNSVVRRIALQVVQGRSIEALQPLYTSLLRPRFTAWRERCVAAWALGRAPVTAEDRDSVLQLLLDILEGGHRDSMGTRLKRGAFLTSSVWLAIFTYFSMREGGLQVWDYAQFVAVSTVIWCILGLFCIPLTVWHERYTTNRIRAAAADSLGKMGSVEAIGTLAAALRDGSPEVRSASAVALHQLLPQVTPAHYGVLGRETMQNLGRALSHPDGQLVFKVLAALENAGTSVAIPWVERSAQRGRTVRVRDVASRVLEILNQRKLRETDRDRLLRATTGNPDSDLLLRSHALTTDDPALLLQPASDGG
jgi:FOG: HEAT repeat